MSASASRDGAPAAARDCVAIPQSIQGQSLLRQLGRDQSGTVAMIFAIILIPLTAIVGLAVDFGRVYSVSSHTQVALDAAALAAGRVAQVETSGVLDKASAAATAYFNQAKPKAVVQSTLQFVPNSTQTEFTVTATSWVRTPFLGAINLLFRKGSGDGAPTGCTGNHFACVRLTTTSTAELKAGGNGGSSVEIALMLDVTGSMAGQKLTDLKSAATDLINIVVWNDQSEFTSKVALAPFSAAINVGSAYFKKITNKSDAEDTNKNGDADGDGYNYPSTCYNSSGNVKSSCKGADQYRAYATCVVERTGTNEATDAVPAGSSTYLPTWNDIKDVTTTSSSRPPAPVEQRCTPAAKIVPLTSQKQVLLDAIDALDDGGSTAGQLGTAFAWYLLSPKWSTIWPTDSKPANYGTTNLKKIAVLMTDGEYNTLQGTQYSDGSSQATTALTKAKALCTAMKKKTSSSDPNIEIFTVGFQLDSNAAKSMLQNCATDTSHFYNTSTGDALRAAFRDIALKISTLRLTH